MTQIIQKKSNRDHSAGCAQQNRRAFLQRCGATALALGGAAWMPSLVRAAAQPAASRPPNILIFYIDDMGYGDLACYGGKLAKTPHLDAIAAAGARFTQGYISACVCSPSRVGLMTGRYQAHTGHDGLTTTRNPDSSLALNEVTMAQRLKKLGYATGITGKWHLGDDEKHLPASRGFDFSYGSTTNMGESDNHFYSGTKTVPIPGPITSPIYRDKAIEFIKANRDKPFFLYLPFNAVHAKHVASQKWLDHFKERSPQEAAYGADIEEMDDAVGGVMQSLLELNLEENTLIFCISDNGGPQTPCVDNGGLRGGKWWLWEGGIRVPFIVHWKGRIPTGQVIHTPAIQLDVLPTVLAAAGAAIDPTWELDGVNLLPLLENKTKQLDRDTLCWRFCVQYAIRKGDWKLVKPYSDAPPRLINLANDPCEKNDLAQQQPEKVKELQAAYDAWNKRMKPPRWDDKRASHLIQNGDKLIHDRKGKGKGSPKFVDEG